MKKIIIILALLLLTATSAYAWNCYRSATIAALGSTRDLVEELYSITECLEERISSLETIVERRIQ